MGAKNLRTRGGVRDFVAAWGVLAVSTVALGVAAVALLVAGITYEVIKVGNNNASRAADLASRPYLDNDPNGLKHFTYYGSTPSRTVNGRVVDVAVVGRVAYFAAAEINRGPGLGQVMGFRVYPAGHLQYSWGFRFKLVRHGKTITQNGWVFPVGVSQVLSKYETLSAARARFLKRWIASGGTIVADVWYENDPEVPNDEHTNVITYQQVGHTRIVGGKEVSGRWVNAYPDMTKCDC